MPENGEGVKQSMMTADELFQQAHEKGCTTATNTLGRKYENGEGVKKDMTMRSSVALLGTTVGDMPFLFDTAAVFHGFLVFFFNIFPNSGSLTPALFPGTFEMSAIVKEAKCSCT